MTDFEADPEDRPDDLPEEPSAKYQTSEENDE